MAESYFSQTVIRYGDYIAKLGVIPTSPGLKSLAAQPFDPQTPDALRDATIAYFRSNPADSDVQIQT